MKRVEWIDSCRFLAMLVIMVTHFLAMFSPDALQLWEQMPGRLILGGITGKLSVAVFFVLLGYFASKPKPFSLSAFGRYTLRRYIYFVFFALLATLLYLLGGYAVTWLFHTPDESVFVILSDGPRYNLIYLLRDGFLLEDHYIDTLWCMQSLFLASIVCRLFGYLPARLGPGLRALLAFAVIALLLLLNAAFFVWVCVGLLGCLLRLVSDSSRELRIKPLLPRLLLFLTGLVIIKLPLDEGPLLYFLQGLVALTWTYLILCAESVQRFLSRAPLPRLGKLTMGLFVLHTPVYSLLRSSLFPLMQKVLPDAATLPLCFCLGVSLTLVGAWLLHRAYDAFALLFRRERVSAR
ncbi:MAG: acyltransferase [Oscillospiraceae bacterium]|nr:acyltransferase [Oscillospiraceae bacterium]